ncbi:MAG: aminotransferase class I/II-fold pyridoxal phosphate-dependent enzyme [Dehalococcoidia bacterium]|nr:aminotransferase class I/II-fold pyridoxal phosphate-dependent enzyme [Dehalococcoidia bacterium]
MSTIDLRSDTVTLPTDAMRRAMADAECGDDVWEEDPTTQRLEAMSAQRMGKQAALFTPSGTMSNLVATLTWCKRGDEMIVGSESHMFWNEVGGASALGGVVMRTVPNDATGRIDPTDVENAIRRENIHFPPTALVALENTHNRCSGAVLTVQDTRALADVAHRHGIPVHLDGARIFNAAVYLGVPAAELAAPADSVAFCVSKGLSAPIGSLLCGTRDFVTRARKWRKMVGGGMRQVGIIAAAGIVALDSMVDRLAEDHTNARRLAVGLAGIPGITLDPEQMQTNIVIFSWRGDAPAFMRRLEERGVKSSYVGGPLIRMVTHRHITTQAVDEAIAIIHDVARQSAVATR